MARKHPSLEKGPSKQAPPAYLGTAIPIMDPVQKRRMQNRVAQRNHRQKVKENKNRAKIKMELTCQTNQDFQPIESVQRLDQIPATGNSSGNIASSETEESGDARDTDTDNGILFANEKFSLTQIAFNKECEMALDTMLDKNINNYQYNILARDNTVPGQLHLDHTTNPEQMTIFDSDVSGSSNHWNFSSVIGSFEDLSEEVKCFAQDHRNPSALVPPPYTTSSPSSITPWPSDTKSGNDTVIAKTSQTVKDFNRVAYDRSSSQQRRSRKSSQRRHRQKSTSHSTHSPSTDTSEMSRDSVESCNPTARYQYIIECVKKAGFDNVDSMVSGYYTLTFDKNSVADRAQTASRGKHLRNVLSSLHENSRDWTTWEARGFRDQIVEAAEGIYGAEFSRLAQRVEKKKSRNKRSASATSVEDKTSVSTSSPYVDDHSMWREGDSIAVLNDDPMIETLSHETLSDLNRLYQNELPDVWALLTELGGGSAAQAEEAAVMAASLLYYTRTNSKIDLKRLLVQMLDSLGGPPEGSIN